MTNQTEAAEQLSLEEINALYTAIARETDVLTRTHRYLEENSQRDMLFTQPLAFLIELKPLIETNTVDSQNLLFQLIMGRDEESIRRTLDLQQRLGDATYQQVSDFMGSLNLSIGRGLVGKAKRFYGDPQKIVALYRVTEALRTIDTTGVPYSERLLDKSTNYGGDNGVYFIQNKELVTFVLENAQHCDVIATSIRTGGGVHYPAIEFLIHGGTAAVSTGAL